MLDNIKNLIQKAMMGTLSRDEFYNFWSSDFDNDLFLNIVFNDIESAMEHIPGKLLSNGIDKDKWESSYQYKILQIDLIVLDEYPRSITLQLIKKRNELLNSVE